MKGLLNKILVIDDNPDDRILIIREIKKEFPQTEIEEVTEKKEFEKALEKMDFDLVITDFQLKWSNGIEILREIKKRNKFIPVIMFTLTGSEEIAVEAMKNGLDDYVLKTPKHLMRLRASIRSVFEKAIEKKEKEETKIKYKELFENLPVGIYRTDYEGKIIEFNPALLEMFGYTEEEFKKLRVQDMYADPEDRENFIKKIEKSGILKGYESQFKRKDGKTFWGKETARAIKDEKGTIKYFEGIIIDITKEKILQQELIQSQRMEAIGKLTGGIAHDFNNILTAIMGFADLLLSTSGINEKEKTYIEEIKKSADRAAILTKKLLAFSRRQLLTFEIVNINDVILDISEVLKRLLGENIELILDLEKKLWPSKVDKTQIQQVIMNLAVNARDAMPAGGKLIIKTKNIIIDEEYYEIHPDAKMGNFILITVEDTGTGISKDIINYIFEPFFTTKPPGEGTGLGLSVAYGIVKQHDGWINVYSEEGRGTSFKIYLPAYFGEEEFKKEKKETFIKEGKKQKILIVEDEENIRKFLSTLLIKNNYIPFEAKNAKEALKIFEEEEIEAVICDMVLPDRSGVELVEEFILKRPNLKVIISSGYINKQKEFEKIKKQGWYFIPKPYTSSQILEILSKIFES